MMGAGAAAAGGCALLGGARADAAENRATRRYHACVSSKFVDDDPGLLALVRDAGVSDIWQAAFFYGHWYETPERLREGRARVEAAGLRWHVINLPLGHPGDSLGDASGETPLTPPGAPGEWNMAVRPDGSRYSGTSLHPPGTQENVEAVRALSALNPDIIFLDDDFRLAQGPGVIGGCFCDWHKRRFLEKCGYTEARWEELLGDVQERRLSSLLRTWVDFTCDELTACFRAQQAAAPETAIGNMVMYLGAEKAGIRLTDYADVPFRVGEFMFDDASFAPVKGKTDELFSALFHRRFVRPELAYSETTAFPADQLSAANMAAKLAVSTIGDVRNTMYMSGGMPVPNSHWGVLAPAMRKHADYHEVLKGHRPAGPFKHFWGEASRYVGDDRPFSLFLATGIPFEVVDRVPTEGWTFLSDFDAREFQAEPGNQGRLVCRSGLVAPPTGLRTMDESLPELWALKQEAIAAGLDAPYVVDEKPAVCAWYPSANSVLVWNLSETKETLRLEWSGQTRALDVEGLDSVLVTL